VGEVFHAGRNRAKKPVPTCKGWLGLPFNGPVLRNDANGRAYTALLGKNSRASRLPGHLIFTSH
jgi:hypothetical protein